MCIELLLLKTMACVAVPRVNTSSTCLMDVYKRWPRELSKEDVVDRGDGDDVSSDVDNDVDSVDQVTYSVNGDGGYVADVSYTGEAQVLIINNQSKRSILSFVWLQR